jgi:hypothetical protein
LDFIQNRSRRWHEEQQQNEKAMHRVLSLSLPFDDTLKYNSICLESDVEKHRNVQRDKGGEEQRETQFHIKEEREYHLYRWVAKQTKTII